MRSLAREATKVAAAMARAERVAELLAADEVLEERPGAYRGGRAPPATSRSSACRSPTSRTGRRCATSRCEIAGRRAASRVMGPSGAGKSTLGALVARFYDPTAGRVLIDGRDARDCSLGVAARAGRRSCCRTPSCSPGRVRENIAYGIDATRAQEIERRGARRPPRTSSSPRCRTATTPSSARRASALSGGQRQRIGIARTLLRDPPILRARRADDRPRRGERGRGARRARRADARPHDDPRSRTRRGSRAAPTASSGSTAGGSCAAARARACRPGAAAARAAARPRGDARACWRARSTGRGARRRWRSAAWSTSRATRSRSTTRAWAARHDAVATCIAGVDLAARARDAALRALARRVDGRSPAAAPVSYDDEVGALVTWLPFDPRCRRSPRRRRELARRLRHRRRAARRAELVGYKPRSRAVLRGRRPCAQGVRRAALVQRGADRSDQRHPAAHGGVRGRGPGAAADGAAEPRRGAARDGRRRRRAGRRHGRDAAAGAADNACRRRRRHASSTPRSARPT